MVLVPQLIQQIMMDCDSDSLRFVQKSHSHVYRNFRKFLLCNSGKIVTKHGPQTLSLADGWLNTTTLAADSIFPTAFCLILILIITLICHTSFTGGLKTMRQSLSVSIRQLSIILLFKQGHVSEERTKSSRPQVSLSNIWMDSSTTSVRNRVDALHSNIFL
jgi:hypothetical protein